MSAAPRDLLPVLLPDLAEPLRAALGDDLLGEANARYLSLIEHVPVVVYVAEFDPASTLRYVSTRIERITGRTPEELLADDEEWYRCIHPDDVERVRMLEQVTFDAQVEFDCEYRMVHRDGTVFHVWERDSVLRAEDGRPLCTQGVLLDVTALRAAEARARDEHRRAQGYLDVSGIVMLALDAEGRVTMLNRAGHELVGHPDGSLVGADWFLRFLPDGEAQLAGYRQGLAARTLPAEIEAELVHRDGHRILVDWRMSILDDEAGRPAGLLISGVDITESRRAQEQVAHMAYHDSLTGLPNRRRLRDHLELALARAARHQREVALLYVDLDDFKLVNDGLGHAAGDDLLRLMAGRLRSRLREEDLVAREGGDEFLVLLADLEPDAAERAQLVAEDLVAALREPVEIGAVQFEVSGSVGVVLRAGGDGDAESLLADADAAMYEAKAAGRGQVRVFRGRRRRSTDRLSMAHRLRRAIADGELLLHWQPIVGVDSGLLKGAEALIRWQDPERGLLEAGEFVADVGAAGLYEQLDAWVVGAFTAQRRAWNAAGLDPYVGLNLGPGALTLHRVAALLDGLGVGELDPTRVTVEISETEGLHDDAAARAALARLVESGVTLALDDFGVAYSSLQRMRDLPTRWIKTDRSFLAGVPQDEASCRVLDALLALLAALEARVIVEGVETPEQLAYLRAQGCEAAQGYLLGRPVPAAELDPLLRESPDAVLTAPRRSAALPG